MPRKLINLIGRRFGRLTVLKRMDNDKFGHSMWLCICNCKDKNEIIVLGSNLQRGHTKSCGCLQKEITIKRSTKHGCSQRGKVDKIYTVWVHMIQRCTNPHNKQWKNYGGRGITVCKRWMKFENFLEDMGKGWKPGLTLERRENELGYFPDNCEWTTYTKQNRNRRDNLYVPYNGENRLLVELCEQHNMPYQVVYKRIYRYGWSIEKALITPVGKRRK